MIHLESLGVQAPAGESPGFPWTVPAIGALAGGTLTFPTPVTFFVGENGSGKSTLLEALAAASGAITVGRAAAAGDPTLQHLRPLVQGLRLRWAHRTRRGFFLRSEDFFGYAQRLSEMRAELEAERAAVLDDPDRSAKSKAFGSLPYNREIADLQRRYGAGLDSASHGESFLALFRARFVPDGLYLLDEPEAPLSPMRQLALIALLKETVETQGAQFLIATHSPILMAAPHATIYSFDDGAVRPIAYADTEHVRLTRDFLNHPDQFLQHL